MAGTHNALQAQGDHSNGRAQESVHTLVLAGKERLQDLVQHSTLCVQEVLAEMRDIIAKCDAEFEVSEDINVVIEPNRAILNVKRTTRFAKDKG